MWIVVSRCVSVVIIGERQCLVVKRRRGNTRCSRDWSSDVCSSDLEARRRGLKPRCVIPVDLYGQPADYKAIGEVAEAHGLLVVADAAQSFGASRDRQKVGTLAPYTATSFYPSKPLGGYGDGGAVFTNDDDRAGRLRALRNHGKGPDQPETEYVGLNSRLDSIQAAILLEKLRLFPREIPARHHRAQRSPQGL